MALLPLYMGIASHCACASAARRGAPEATGGVCARVVWGCSRRLLWGVGGTAGGVHAVGSPCAAAAAFWVTRDVYYEQPRVVFTDQLLVYVEGVRGAGRVPFTVRGPLARTGAAV